MRRAGPERSDQKNTSSGRRRSYLCLLESGRTRVLYAPENSPSKLGPPLHCSPMGDWYTIGLALGLGTALGVLLAGLLSATPLGRISAVVLGAAAGRDRGVLIEDWTEIAAGAVGGARRRSGRRGDRRRRAAARRHAWRAGPDRGVVRSAWRGSRWSRAPAPRAVALPVLAMRRHRAQPDRYAGLRSLARDYRAEADPDHDRRPDALDARGARSSAAALPRSASRRARPLPPAVSTFPSLTPVCLSALATGAHPRARVSTSSGTTAASDECRVRLSFGVVRAAGTKRSLSTRSTASTRVTSAAAP